MFEGEFKDGKNWNGNGKKWEELFLLTGKTNIFLYYLFDMLGISEGWNNSY